jgi:chromosome partitioning protein
MTAVRRQSAQKPSTLEQLEQERASATSNAFAELHGRALEVLDQLRLRGADETGERLPFRFSISRAAELVGRTAAAIREAEKDGRLPAADRRRSSNHRVGYTLKDINGMRAAFGTRPWRADSDPACIIAVQNFKGGVGKSTVSAHLAQYLAIQGYRVCLVDCDSQGTSTSLFGYVPDLDIAQEHTLQPYLRELEVKSLAYALRDTSWDGLSLIPANLYLYSSEYELASQSSGGDSLVFNRLAEGLASIEDRFDVIILDPPPALGAISLAVMRAANALLVPMPPTVVDFTSSTTFFGMLSECMDALERGGMPVDLRWMKILATRVDEQKSIQKEILGLMRSLFGDVMLRTVLKDSAEIDNASARLMTVYELSQPVTSRETYQRCLTYLNAVNAEVLTQIRLTWPSHAESLRADGVL